MSSSRLYSTCPLCGDNNIRLLWQINVFPVAFCEKCTLVFVQTKVSADELATHYSSVTDPVYDEEDNAACLEYYYRKLRSLIEIHVPQKGKVLDVGCAAGGFLDTMTGWECYGTEIVPAYVKRARIRHGENIFAGSFEEYPVKNDYFDVITLQDVFDHMREPIESLQRCFQMLKPSGLLVIKVHNISCLYAKLSGKYFYALVPPSHLFYYNKSTLQLALQKTGFGVISSHFIAHSLTIQTVLFRLSRNNPESVFYRLYHRIAGTRLGKCKMKKNLHDVITVLAQRQSGNSPSAYFQSGSIEGP